MGQESESKGEGDERERERQREREREREILSGLQRCWLHPRCPWPRERKWRTF